MVEAVAKKYHIDLDAPVKTIPQDKLEKILTGTAGETLSMHFQGRNDRSATYETAFEGVINNLTRRYRDTQSEYIRAKISEFMSDRPCPTCNGKRLRPEALAVTINDTNIIEVTNWPVNKTLGWFKGLESNVNYCSRPRENDFRTDFQGDHCPAWFSGGCRVWITLTLQRSAGHFPVAKPNVSGLRPRSGRA